MYDYYIFAIFFVYYSYIILNIIFIYSYILFLYILSISNVYFFLYFVQYTFILYFFILVCVSFLLYTSTSFIPYLSVFVSLFITNSQSLLLYRSSLCLYPSFLSHFHFLSTFKSLSLHRNTILLMVLCFCALRV